MTTGTIRAPEYTLYIPQGATLKQRFVLPVSAGVDSIYAQIYSNLKRTTLVLSLDVDILATSPKYDITIGATWEQTRLIKKDAYWDLLVVYLDGTRDYYLQGPTTFDPGLSVAP